MTVSTTNRLAGPYAGNDVTTQFPFVFRMFSTADLLVVTNLAGVETTLMLGVDFTATLNADQNGNPGGAITLVAPLASTKTLVITSNVPATQLTLVTNAGGFFPAVFNAVFDKLTILVQQLAQTIGRAFVVPLTYAGSAVLPVVPSGVLQWAADGLSLQAVTLPDLSLSLALPAQGGHANHALYSNGVVAAWRAPLITDVTGLGSALNYCNAAASQAYAASLAIGARATVAESRLAALESRSNFNLNAAVIF